MLIKFSSQNECHNTLASDGLNILSSTTNKQDGQPVPDGIKTNKQTKSVLVTRTGDENVAVVCLLFC